MERVCAWENLLDAWRQAARGKRGKPGVAAFEHQVADRLLDLRERLAAGTWEPGGYVHFTIDTPKRRCISAAPFADRVVHHALCNVIEPVFERLFIPDSYANRPGKGTHRALDRAQALCRRHRYVLQLDIVKHFPSIDHAILLELLGRHLRDPRLRDLAARIIASGDAIAEQDGPPVLFPGDDLLAACRPRGLPIGNLTSQFWSNCYLHPLDRFVTRGLGCKGYVRYVDDMLLFADSKAQLWDWKRAVVERLAGLRLRVHAGAAQLRPVCAGVPWLGFVLYPTHRLVKARKAVAATRRLEAAFDAWREGRMSFARFDASVQGWINHVRYADSWGLRERVLSRFVW
jgi:RNA-directed DNA polymerase